MNRDLTRRRFLQTSSAAVIMGAFPGLVAGRQRNFKIEEVRGNISVFKAQGGTIGFMVDEKGLAVVDSQFARTAAMCLNELNKRRNEAPIEFLINTHHHGDHTGGNGTFRKSVKKIVGHDNVPKYQRQQAKQQKREEPTVPDTTFAKTWSGKVGKQEIRAKHYGPAHTGGDAVVTFVGANVAHMGDLVFHERHPFIDPPAGASILNWPKVLDAAIKDHDEKTRYIFGHGKGDVVVGGRKEVERFRDYLAAVTNHARGCIGAGKSRDETTKLDLLKGFESYGAGSGRLSLAGSLGVAYDELSKKK